MKNLFKTKNQQEKNLNNTELFLSLKKKIHTVKNKKNFELELFNIVKENLEEDEEYDILYIILNNLNLDLKDIILKEKRFFNLSLYFYKLFEIEELINIFFEIKKTENNEVNSKIFFINLLKMISYEYNKDKKIGYVRKNFNKILSKNEKLFILAELIDIYNNSTFLEQKKLNEIILTLNNFIFIDFNTFTILLKKIDYFNNIRFNTEKEIFKTNKLIKEKYKLLNLHNININHFLSLFIFNLLGDNINDIKKFKIRLLSNNLNINTIVCEMLKNINIKDRKLVIDLLFLLNIKMKYYIFMLLEIIKNDKNIENIFLKELSIIINFVNDINYLFFNEEEDFNFLKDIPNIIDFYNCRYKNLLKEILNLDIN